MKKAILPFLFLLLCLQAFAQGRFQGGNDDGYASDSSSTQSLSTPLGFATTSDWELKASPNPTQDITFLSIPFNGSGFLLKVLDLAGKQVMEDVVFTGNAYTLDLSSLSAGTYFVAVQYGDKVGIVKVVRE